MIFLIFLIFRSKIVHNKKEISLDNDSFIGTRDRSWGVRPVGAYDSQPMVPFSMPQFYWLWAPIHFDDSAAHIYFVEDEKGNASSTIAIAQGPEYEDEFTIQDIKKCGIRLYDPNVDCVMAVNTMYHH